MSDVITLDGPASSGKSSVGFALAKKIGYKFIDTGAIYRAGCLQILQTGVDLTNEAALTKIFKNLKVEINEDQEKDRIFLDGQDVTDSLHDTEVTQIVSIVSAIGPVREASKTLQRQICLQQNTVMAGRDIGTEIFPEAKLKFFLTARPEVRAKRRFDQLKKKDPDITFVKVYTDMVQRDERDSTRETSPMRIPEDAIIIDNSDKTVDETVNQMLTYIDEKSPP